MDELKAAVEKALSEGTKPEEIVKYVTGICHAGGEDEKIREEKEMAGRFGLPGFVD